MAMSTPFFNKREPITPSARPASPLPSAPAYGASAIPAPLTPPEPVAARTTALRDGGAKLTVGPNIKLKGVEITDCDILLVEGLVEATMDSRVIQISAQGAFKGSAEIDIAEIHGQFDGSLTVREKLTIYATGKVSGKIRYGKVVIEEGGQLSGDIQFGASAASPVGQAAMPGLTVAA